MAIAMIAIQINGKFYLHGNSQSDFPNFQQFRYNLRQREIVMLQDTGKSEHLQPLFLQIIGKPVILIIPHRSYVFQGAMPHGIFDIQLGQGYLLAFGEIEIILCQIKRVEFLLRTAHHLFLGEHVCSGVFGTKAEIQLPFHHRFPQTQGDIGDTIRMQHMRCGIEIIALRHPGDVRIVVLAAFQTSHGFLNDHGHLLFFSLKIQGFQKSPRFREVHRGKHQLDSIHQLPQAMHFIRMIIG